MQRLNGPHGASGRLCGEENQHLVKVNSTWLAGGNLHSFPPTLHPHFLPPLFLHTHSQLSSSLSLSNLPISYHTQFHLHLPQTLLSVIKLSAENARRKHHILHRVNSLVGGRRRTDANKINNPPHLIRKNHSMYGTSSMGTRLNVAHCVRLSD